MYFKNLDIPIINMEKDGIEKMPCVVTARGGSKSIPRKNLKILDGKPLVLHSIDFAIKSEVFDEVYISSEDDEILEVCKKRGAIPIKRPEELALDTSPMPPVLMHWLEEYKLLKGDYPKYFCLLMPTTPFRREEDVLECSKILQSEDCDSCWLVFEPEDPPYWALLDKGGFLSPTYPKEYFYRHQDVPKSYYGGPCYMLKTKAFMEKEKHLTEKTRYVVVRGKYAIDIDSETDFKWAEFWIERIDTDQ